MIQVLLPAFVIWWLTPVPPVALEADRATTYFDTSLADDGLPDFTAGLNAELLKRRIKAEDNAAVVFMQVLGPDAIEQQAQWERNLRDLGASPQTDVPRLRDVAEFAAAHHVDKTKIQDEIYGSDIHKPWSAPAHPLFAEWLDVNEGALNQIVTAMRRSNWLRLFGRDASPIFPFNHISFIPIVQSRKLAMMLSARAMRKVDVGDWDGAREDILAIYRMGRLLRQEPMLISIMVANSLEGLANSRVQELVSSGRLAGKQASLWLQAITTLPEADDVVPALDLGERAFLLDILAQTQRRPEALLDTMALMSWTFGHTSVLPLWMQYPDMVALGIYMDTPSSMRTINRWIEREKEAWPAPTTAQRIKQMDHLLMQVRQQVGLPAQAREVSIFQQMHDMTSGASQVEGLGNLSLRFNRTMMLLSLPPEMRARWAGEQLAHVLTIPCVKAMGSFIRTDVHKQRMTELSRLALALTVYRERKGAYPAKLEDLVPEYLPVMPTDGLLEKPFFYKQQDGKTLVYSVRGNEQDHGGDPKFDLVVTLP